MSWTAVLLLCAAAYALKFAGAAMAGRGGAMAEGRLDVLVVPVIAGLIAVQTFSDEKTLVLDGRALALLVAALLIWRKAPLLVVVFAAGGTAALLHALGA